MRGTGKILKCVEEFQEQLYKSGGRSVNTLDRYVQCPNDNLENDDIPDIIGRSY